MRVFINAQLNSMQSNPKISAETTMKQLQELMPGARRALFAKYHIGGCQSCGFDDSETIGEVCKRNEDLPVDDVLKHLSSSAEHDQKIQINPSDLKKELDQEDTDIKLLDIRSREEFEAVKIPGSEIMTADLQQEALGKWGKETRTIIIDHTGDRSLDVAAFFIGHGLNRTVALAGGIDAYSKEVDPNIPRYRIEIEPD
ncbi:MAG: rhodanese-like domain-containing protein [Verrucomicrobiota bacterium]|nr:rhodanese-like domain-containing protein [Verrucomicrobiota bacterium]